MSITTDRNSTNFPLEVFNYLEKIDKSSDILQYHQKIVHQYFIANPNSRGLLVFHGTGIGKTMLAVAIADELKDDYNVVILSPKSLQHNFKKEIVKYLKLKGFSELEINDIIAKKYQFISSNAGNMLTQLARLNKSKEQIDYEKTIDVIDNIDLENTLLIVDEAQHHFNGVISGSKNATGLHHAILAAKKIKMVFLSATPIINDPFELVPVFNSLAGYTLLPEDYDNFYEMFVDTENIQVKNRDKFKNRIFGLISYMGDWWKTGGVVKPDQIIKRPFFPDQLPIIIERIPMSSPQFSAYANARSLESQVKGKRTTKIVTLQKPKSDPSSTFRVASRQISNFLLPETIKVKKIGEHGFTKHIGKLNHFHFSQLEIYSPKMKKILDNIALNPGLAVVYSAFVSGEGLNIFAKILDDRSWKRYDGKEKLASEKSYIMISGDVPSDERASLLAEFTRPENRDGEIIDLLLLSSAGAEGLDLKNVKSIHIMEPYWNYGRIEQIIARVIRYKSHEAFTDPIDKVVQPYIYLSDYPTDFVFKPTKTKPTPESTTDVHLYMKSLRGKVLIDRFYAVMIEASIDCSIHIRDAPDDVKKKINCLMCIPTAEQLFNPSYDMDIKLRNPCQKPTQSTIKANEIIVDGSPYYYIKQPNNEITIYRYSDSLGSYVEVDRSDPNFSKIIDQLRG